MTVKNIVISVENIVKSNRVKNKNETSKYFIGYLDDIDKVTPLRIVLPQMSGYIKHFEKKERI